MILHLRHDETLVTLLALAVLEEMLHKSGYDKDTNDAIRATAQRIASEINRTQGPGGPDDVGGVYGEEQ